MIEFDNQTEKDIDINLCEKVLKHFGDKDVELVALDSDKMKELNKTFRGKDESTDVLSFPLQSVENAPIGSIVINIDRVKDAASTYGHNFDDEFALLFLHGLLHLLGYDHETDNGEMREMEEQTIKELGLPDSLIVRSMK